MVMKGLSEADHARVSEAVARAEQASDGEIVTIVADKSDSYHDVGLHYAVLGMLLVPAVLAFVPQGGLEAFIAPFVGWSETLEHGALMVFLFVVLALAFLAVRFLLAWMPLRMALTPGSTKSRRVRRRAIQLFRVGAERRTVGRTGVLIYLSLAEHRAEIVADEAIHSKVEAEVWGDAMAALVEGVKAGRTGDGMVGAVERVGAVLAACLPRSAEDTNELPDRLIEL